MSAKKDNIIQVIKFVLFSTSAGIIQTVTFTLLTELPPKLFETELPYWACYLPALVLSVVFNFTVLVVLDHEVGVLAPLHHPGGVDLTVVKYD